MENSTNSFYGVNAAIILLDKELICYKATMWYISIRKSSLKVWSLEKELGKKPNLFYQSNVWEISDVNTGVRLNQDGESPLRVEATYFF